MLPLFSCCVRVLILLCSSSPCGTALVPSVALCCYFLPPFKTWLTTLVIVKALSLIAQAPCFVQHLYGFQPISGCAANMVVTFSAQHKSASRRTGVVKSVVGTLLRIMRTLFLLPV